MTDTICFIHPNTAPLHSRSAYSLGTTCIPAPHAQSAAYFKLMDRAVNCNCFTFCCSNCSTKVPTTGCRTWQTCWTKNTMNCHLQIQKTSFIAAPSYKIQNLMQSVSFSNMYIDHHYKFMLFKGQN